MSDPLLLQRAIAAQRAGELNLAVALYSRIVCHSPFHSEGLICNFAHALFDLGHFGSASRLYSRLADASAMVTDYHLWHADALIKSGEAGNVEALQARALAVSPGFLPPLVALGITRYGERDFRTAIRLFRRAATCDPRSLTALLNLGAALNEAGDVGQSALILSAAIALEPAEAPPWNNLGLALQRGRFHRSSLLAYSRGLAIDPKLVSCRLNLAWVLREVGGLDEAVQNAIAAVCQAPQNAAAWRVFGLISHSFGFLDVVAASFQRKRRLRPEDAANDQDMLFLAAYRTDWDRRIAVPRSHARTHPPIRRPASVSVGYVSSDFRICPLGNTLLPVLENHDPSRVRVHCFSDVDWPDPLTERFRQIANQWVDLSGCNDRTAADRIRKDGLDILVVLGARFDGNRAFLARHRSAPVQISFHDVASTGLAEMDYLIADRHLVPRDSDEYFSERVLRVPCFVQLPDLPELEVTRPPLLTNGFASFACFGNPAKINDATLSVWAEIMTAVPDSRLTLGYLDWYRSALLRHRILSRLDPRRVSFILTDRRTRASHLGLYREVDVSLDTWPFSGSTTTLESLWMGVPVISFPTKRMVSAWSRSILESVGLGEFAITDRQEVAHQAALIASNPERLTLLRSGMRERIKASSLCNARSYARHLERIYFAVSRYGLPSVSQTPS